jgi:hypothetical protein
MSIVMMFTFVAMPVSAAEEAAKEEITINDVITTVELTVNMIQDTLVQVHFIVGTILGILEKECPLCGEAHEVDFSVEAAPEEAPEAAPELAA